MCWGGSHVPVDILLLYNIMRLPSSLSQFRSIFLLLTCHRFTCVIWLFQSHDVCRNFTLTGPRWWQGVFFFTFYFVCFRQRRHFCNAKSAPQIMVLPASGTAAMTLKHAVRISTFALPMSSWPWVRPPALSAGALPWRNIRIWLTHVIHLRPLALWWIVHALLHTAITMDARLISNTKMDRAEVDWQFRKFIRHFRNEK